MQELKELNKQLELLAKVLDRLNQHQQTILNLQKQKLGIDNWLKGFQKYAKESKQREGRARMGTSRR